MKSPRAGAVLALLTALLVPIGVSGGGDLPDPHDTNDQIATAFATHRDDILTLAPIGYMAAVGTAVVGWWLARSLPPPAATVVRAGAAIAATYYALLQVIYTTLAYGADVSGLFVVTILAVPVWAIGVSALSGGVAWGGSLSRWATIASSAAAVAVLPALVSFEDSGLFSPDVQQQVVGNVLIIWLVIAGVTTLRRPPAVVEAAALPHPPSNSSTKERTS
jgi:hypothetical protein